MRFVLALILSVMAWPALAQYGSGVAPNSGGGSGGGSVTQGTTPWVTSISQTTPGTTNGVVVNSGAVTISGTIANQPTARTSVQTTALAANLVVSAAAANLYSFSVFADSTLYASDWYVMIYNATSAPADGAVTPVKCYTVPAQTRGFTQTFPNPIAFSTGVTIGVSTTGCFTKTASTHATFISGDY